MTSGLTVQSKIEIMSYQDLQIELKNTLAAVKREPKNTVPYIRLKRKANDLHVRLIETEKMLSKFK